MTVHEVVKVKFRYRTKKLVTVKEGHNSQPKKITYLPMARNSNFELQKLYNEIIRERKSVV